MLEFDSGYFNLEHPAPGAPLPAGRQVLRGWLVGKPGQVLTDLRVRCADRVWPAVHGFVRPDLAAHFNHPTSNLPAAFEVLIFLEPGPAVLEFEALAISGCWHPVHTARVEVSGPPAPPFVPNPEAKVNASEFAQILRHLLRLRAAEPAPGMNALAGRVAASLPCPRYLLHPSPPFRAFFDEPAIITRAAYGRLLVEGYLFHEQLPIKRVLATFDLHVWQAVPHGSVSPIAPELFPQYANAIHSKVKGYIEAPSQLPRPITLRIYAELADGSIYLCTAQQTFTYGVEDEKKPYPPASPVLYLQAARALHTQLKSTGIAVTGGAPLCKELWQTWRDYRLRAPRHRSKVPCLAQDAAVPATAPLGAVMVFTQNLDYEGAPLLLLEYCRHLIRHDGARLTLVSSRDGLLRAEFLAASATVQIVDATPLARAESAGAWRAALRKISSELDCRGANLIVANTLASYWAIHLAHEARRPSLFYIHESTTPAAFYHGTAARTVIPFVEASFGLATRVSFNTAHTSRYYEPLATHANYYLNPGWIDLAALDAHRAAYSRTGLRAALGVAAGRKLVINLGAVCERKGQHVFAWAVDLFWRRHPDLTTGCDFWMVGGRRTPFDDWMAALVASLGRPNLRLIPETPRAYDFLGAADLFVCSSYEESFPRVVLEAMAMQVPILSTDVHGIPEMVTHGENALLVPPGDSSALADGLARLLFEPDLARDYAKRARLRLETHFDSAIILPRQVDLAHRVIAAHAAGN